MESSNYKEMYEAISKRMSVREYGDQIITPELCDKIDAFIDKINKEEDIFKSKIKEEDFVDIISLKQNLEFMKNVLNKKMSENLIIIYINIENFCKVFSPIIE